MMHPTAEDGFRRMLAGADLTLCRDTTSMRGLHVLDVGGADVNGVVHALINPRATIDVLDVAPGEGVTIVADATKLDTWKQVRTEYGLYDLIITTETLEHVQDWRTIVWGAAVGLRRGGWFIGTCAGPGRRPHGARGEYDPPTGEWYMNVGPDVLAEALLDNFDDEVVVEYSRRPEFPTTHDLYWRARVLP